MPASIARCPPSRRLDVPVHLGAALGGFRDEQLDVLDGVAPRLAIHADLDRLRAEEQVLAHRLDDLVGRVGLEVSGYTMLWCLYISGVGVELPTGACR